MTYMLLLNCALKLVEDIILYYDGGRKNIKKTLLHIQTCCVFDFLTLHLYVTHTTGMP